MSSPSPIIGLLNPSSTGPSEKARKRATSRNARRPERNGTGWTGGGTETLQLATNQNGA